MKTDAPMANDGRVSPLWNIRESKTAREQLDALTGTNANFDKIWIGVRWLLIRDPVANGQLVVGKKLTYVHKTFDFLAIGMPEMMVTYSIIDEKTRVCEIVSVLDANATKNKIAIAKTG